MMDFVAIDFETANERRCSPCALGMAVMSGGRLTETAYWLIRPKDGYFNPFNVGIHGITDEDVRDEPEFPDLWAEIRSRIEGKMVLAHNASFDMSVLRNTLLEYQLPLPEFEYSCTRNIAKKIWPGLPSYALKLVAAMLNIKFKHHQAQEDAMACAEIATRAMHVAGTTSVTELADRLGCIRRMCPGGYERASAHGKSGRATIGDLKRQGVKTESARATSSTGVLEGKTLVVTGTLNNYSGDEIKTLIKTHGGRATSSVSKNTDYVVAGESPGNKLDKAKELGVKVLSEKEFEKLLKSKT